MKRGKTEKAEFEDITGTTIAVFGNQRRRGKTWAQVRELEEINNQLQKRIKSLEITNDASMALINRLSDACNLSMQALQTGNGKKAALSEIRKILGTA